MQQVSEAEAALLALQPAAQPNAIACLVQLAATPEAPLSLQTLQDLLSQRLHLYKRLRQCLVTSPGDIGLPYWCDDPGFDLSSHLSEEVLSGGDFPTSLRAAVDGALSAPLPFSQPLWSITLYNGIGANGCALLIRYHVALVDTETGDEPVSVLLDLSPEGRYITSVPLWQPAPLPTTWRLLRALSTHPIRLTGQWSGRLRVGLASRLHQSMVSRWRHLALPAALFKTRLAPFNVLLEPHRRLVEIRLDFQRIRRLKQRLANTTVTAILLALCGQALGQGYATGNQCLTALAPVSVRSRRIRSPSGSQLAAMILPLGSADGEPLQRVLEVHRALHQNDAFAQAIAADRLQGISPASLMALAGRSYLELQSGSRHWPLFNLPIINIPGSQRRYFVAGRAVTDLVLAPPLFDGVGLAVTLVTIDQQVCISLIGTPETLPDEARCKGWFAAALEDMEDAADEARWRDLQQEAQMDTPTSGITGALINDSRQLAAALAEKSRLTLSRQKEKRPRSETLRETDSRKGY